MPKPGPRKDSAANQAQILDAATHEFADKGFSGARMDTIARRASINKAMIYYHIGDKKALYGAVLNATFGNMATLITENIAWEKSPGENLRMYLQTIAASIRQNPRIPPIMLRETASGGKNLPDGVVRSLRIILEILARILNQGVATKEFHPASSLMVHFMLIGPLVFLNQMKHLIKTQIRRMAPETLLTQWPEDIYGEIETLIFRAISVKE
ncbi:MAG: TetR/AcrR family transcriptional regulator [Desulfococcus multivorans]|jgi:AcrR family transcriptional regulator|nr:TetR/AcrR family transcriptional regulator [Desulfococcus multivorans]